MKKTFGIASAAAPTASAGPSATAGPVPDLTGKTLRAASIDLDRYRDGTEFPAGSGEFTKFPVPSQERKRGRARLQRSR